MAPVLTQVGKPMRVDTPLGGEVLLLQHLECREAVSRQYEVSLSLLSTDAAIDPKKLLRKPVAVTVELASGGKRYFHGLVQRFQQGARTLDGLVSYRAELVPATWFLSLTSDCRIFQQKSVPDIVKQVLNEMGVTDVRFALAGSYAQREYCVQYRESYLDFISRLMEEEGIFYFFEHASDKHTLVVADAPSAVKAGAVAKLKVNLTAGGNLEDDWVTRLDIDSGVVSGKVTLGDYNNETPKTRLETTVQGTSKVAGASQLRRYDYPGKFSAMADGERLARVRMEQAESLGTLVTGTTNYRGLATGQKLEIAGHYRGDVNQAYHILSAHHLANEGSYMSGDQSAFSFETGFEAIPHAVPYRPARITPRSVVQGTQTAVVVGPAGEEIYVDKYGRVKVQFFWDQQGKKDEHSSCWVRVSSAWAGKQWGFVTLPRIGQEVVVDFLEGDPDRPIVVGRVYNAEQMPPYDLPANASQSGLLSRSTKGGTAADFNELRFEDKKDSEMITLHAQKDLTTVVENDEIREVGRDRTTAVKRDETIAIDGKRTETVKLDETVTVEGKRSVTITNDETLVVKSGNYSAAVQTGKQTVTVKGNREVEVQQGNDVLKVSMGNVDTKVNMGNVTLKAGMGSISYDAMQGIELKVGANSIKIDQSGVTIKGMKVSVEGSIMTEVKGVMTTVKADGILTVKGAMTMIN